jgi:gamma-glutamylcyclotransferase (GGCT)/AIG2-like uncharacterized protein YtfP
LTRTILVYGTLRRGSPHPNARRLAREAVWLGPARAKGALWRITHYPGFVAGLTGRVTGDLYRLRSGTSFGWLDPYEMCGPDDPPPHPYARGRTPVRWRGRAMSVGTYLWVAPVSGLRRLARGDWLSQ